MSSKSYWQDCVVSSENQTTIASWFAGLADDMTFTKVEILCDKETDREKKIRAFARKGDAEYVFTKTKGAKFKISRQKVKP